MAPATTPSRFDADSLPPTDTLWTISAIDLAGRLVARKPEPVDRQPSRPHPQHRRLADHPRRIHQVRWSAPGMNWLQCPQGRFNLVLELFSPNGEALQGKWIPPLIEREARRTRTTDAALRLAPYRSCARAETERWRRKSGATDETPCPCGGCRPRSCSRRQPGVHADTARNRPGRTRRRATSAASGGEIDPAALKALEKMTRYLGALKSFEVTTSVDGRCRSGERTEAAVRRRRRPQGEASGCLLHRDAHRPAREAVLLRRQELHDLFPAHGPVLTDRSARHDQGDREDRQRMTTTSPSRSPTSSTGARRRRM